MYETRTQNSIHPQDTRSIAELVQDLRDETVHLVKDEVALAKVELAEKAEKIKTNGILIGASGLAAYGAFLCILAAICLGVYLLLDGLIGAGPALWLSPLFVGVTIAIIGYAFAQKGLNGLKADKLKPRETIRATKETQQWIASKV